MDLPQILGKRIRYYRKQKHMSLRQLADIICKSVSTLSKYESGQIVLDITTLYDIAHAFHLPVEQLLYHEEIFMSPTEKDSYIPAFFHDVTRLYLYFFDGRSHELVRGVCDISEKVSPQTYKVNMYVNIDSYEYYQNCENTYHGILKHFDALSTLELVNRDTDMDKYIIHIPASYINSPTKWALDLSISCRPIMPIAGKTLFSKEVQDETKEFIQSLLFFNKEDYKRLRNLNFLSII